MGNFSNVYPKVNLKKSLNFTIKYRFGISSRLRRGSRIRYNRESKENSLFLIYIK